MCAALPLVAGTCGLVAMTSAPHAAGRQLDPGQVYHFGRAHLQLMKRSSSVPVSQVIELRMDCFHVARPRGTSSRFARARGCHLDIDITNWGNDPAQAGSDLVHAQSMETLEGCVHRSFALLAIVCFCSAPASVVSAAAVPACRTTCLFARRPPPPFLPSQEIEETLGNDKCSAAGFPWVHQTTGLPWLQAMTIKQHHDSSILC